MALVFVFHQRALDLVSPPVLSFCLQRTHDNCGIQDQIFQRAEPSFADIAAKPYTTVNAGRG